MSGTFDHTHWANSKVSESKSIAKSWVLLE
jgi:hypothetical protein